MAFPSLQLTLLLLTLSLTAPVTPVSADNGDDEDSFLFPAPPSQLPLQQLYNGQEFHEFPHLSTSTTTTSATSSLLQQILAHLGFQELSISVRSSLSNYPALAHWSGPTTIFAPSDDSLDSCRSCSAARLLAEHSVPGFFSSVTLRNLVFGTKIETMNPRHCITITHASDGGSNNGTARIFVDGVEITRPDLFDNGLLIIHGLHGYVSLLSQSSCVSTSPRPPYFPSTPLAPPSPSSLAPSSSRLFMSLMLRDAILRLRSGGYGVLALAMKAKYDELMVLQNATVFAVEDDYIFSDPHNYAGNVRHHIVPNRFLSRSDLGRLPAGSTLQTMDEGQYLVVTTAGVPDRIQINYARVKIPEVVKNMRVVVHSLFVPFAQVQVVSPAPSPSGSILRGSENPTAADTSPSLQEQWTCAVGPTEVEDHHGP